jgi:hypothetical protein
MGLGPSAACPGEGVLFALSEIFSLTLRNRCISLSRAVMRACRSLFACSKAMM